ncbi:MAG: N-acetyltransferase [Candidatus Heimdallarchaeota archaeon]|nr:N-acetyltransferase [Candidatus Heimdallarchaeota archaeon]MCK4611191.1 N-acetyltransferase [Candidatus Heimdallarchaeota archaeon]
MSEELVKLGKNAVIGKYVDLGVIPKADNIEPLIIGDNCIIRSHSVIYTNTIIGRNCQTGHGVLIRENNKIGDNVSIGTHSVLERDIVIEDNVRIHSNVFISEYTHLEKNSWIGPNVVMINAYHPLCDKVKECLKGPTIKKHAIVGAGVLISPYVTIGERAFIGAGSLVTIDVPDGMVAYGFPAKIIKKTADLSCKTGIKKAKAYEVEK